MAVASPKMIVQNQNVADVKCQNIAAQSPEKAFGQVLEQVIACDIDVAVQEQDGSGELDLKQTSEEAVEEVEAKLLVESGIDPEAELDSTKDIVKNLPKSAIIKDKEDKSLTVETQLEGFLSAVKNVVATEAIVPLLHSERSLTKSTKQLVDETTIEQFKEVDLLDLQHEDIDSKNIFITSKNMSLSDNLVESKVQTAELDAADLEEGDIELFKPNSLEQKLLIQQEHELHNVMKLYDIKIHERELKPLLAKTVNIVQKYGDKIVSQVEANIDTVVVTEKNKFIVHLEPRELGKIEIIFSPAEEGNKLVINADKISTFLVMKQLAQQIKDNLNGHEGLDAKTDLQLGYKDQGSSNEQGRGTKRFEHRFNQSLESDEIIQLTASEFLFGIDRSFDMCV